MEETNTQETKGNKAPMIIGSIILVVLLIGAGVFYFKNQKANSSDNMNSIVETANEENSETSEASMSDETASVSSTASPSASSKPGVVKEFVVDGNNFSFSPKEIKVNLGDTVKITFKDDDGMHNLVVDGYNVKTKIIKGGTQDTIQFVADKAGTFKYYCSVANHQELGMVGNLIVN